MKTKLNVSQFVASSYPVSMHRSYTVETELNSIITVTTHFILATARESLDAALDYCKNNVDKGLPCRVMFGKEVVAAFNQKND